MKKTLLLLILFVGLMQSRAGDTLTIRQVFNFSVGDTGGLPIFLCEVLYTQ